MSIEIKVPNLPESVADATVLNWHIKVGDVVARDDILVELETDKVVLEVPSPIDGKITSIAKETGTVVNSEELLAEIEENAKTNEIKETSKDEAKATSAVNNKSETLSPATRRAIADNKVAVDKISGTGKHGRITKQDVLKHVEKDSTIAPDTSNGRAEQRVPMSRLRAKIAERLLQSQASTAMLTTFNEINMYEIMQVRAQYKDEFEKKHGAKLGFMSFFTKAVCAALKEFPSVNAAIDGSDIIYHGYYDIGIAVSTDRGLVVPVLRNVADKTMAEIELEITDFATRARDNKITIEDMQGGTFTITNGGVFGSLLSTPIINPPQSAIMGMHKIEKRPIVENDEVVIRPMMYVALSYDHRLIDGRESVQFLAFIKKHLEDPVSLMLGL